jgi:hypothetical protein
MTAFHQLVQEVLVHDARLLVDERVGQYQQRRVIVQRADGAIWEAWDAVSNDEAQPWSLVQMEYVYLHAAVLFPLPCELDCEALWHAISFLQAMDEVSVILGRAS